MAEPEGAFRVGASSIRPAMGDEIAHARDDTFVDRGAREEIVPAGDSTHEFQLPAGCVNLAITAAS